MCLQATLSRRNWFLSLKLFLRISHAVNLFNISLLLHVDIVFIQLIIFGIDRKLDDKFHNQINKINSFSDRIWYFHKLCLSCYFHWNVYIFIGNIINPWCYFPISFPCVDKKSVVNNDDAYQSWCYNLTCLRRFV